MNKTVIEQMVKKVLKEMNEGVETSYNNDVYSNGIFDEMDDAIEAAVIGQKKLSECSMKQRKDYVEAIKKALGKESNINMISKLGAEETGMGKYEHKIIKNRLAVEKTPGTEDLITEAMAGDDGLTLVELSPFGVIGAITPTTNPSETIICNTIGMIASGNSVVFSPHPRARKTSLTTIGIINKALKNAGAPENLVVMVKEPSIEKAEIMVDLEL